MSGERIRFFGTADDSHRQIQDQAHVRHPSPQRVRTEHRLFRRQKPAGTARDHQSHASARRTRKRVRRPRPRADTGGEKVRGPLRTASPVGQKGFPIRQTAPQSGFQGRFFHCRRGGRAHRMNDGGRIVRANGRRKGVRRTFRAQRRCQIVTGSFRGERRTGDFEIRQTQFGVFPDFRGVRFARSQRRIRPRRRTRRPLRRTSCRSGTHRFRNLGRLGGRNGKISEFRGRVLIRQRFQSDGFRRRALRRDERNRRRNLPRAHGVFQSPEPLKTRTRPKIRTRRHPFGRHAKPSPIRARPERRHPRRRRARGSAALSGTQPEP